MRHIHVFLVALLFSLIIQAVYWNTFEVVDGYHWIVATEALMTLSPTMFDTFTYGYPGTPPMMLAIGVHWLFGVPLGEAFYGSLAIFISVACALTALICKIIRPQLPWWLGVTVALSTSNLYRHATPPSTIAFPFVVLIVVLSLLIYEQKFGDKKWPFIFLGAAVGIGAAARLDITLFVAVNQVLFLWFFIGWSAVAFTTLVAVLVFFLLNPFMWIFPVHHLSAFVHKFFYHYNRVTDAASSLSLFFKFSPFSGIGLLYAIFFALWRKTNEVIPRMFILNMLFITVTLVTILYNAHYSPLWYFSPLLLIWEVLFILLMLELASRARYILGFTPTSLLGLYIVARLSLLIVSLFNREAALFFFG